MEPSSGTAESLLHNPDPGGFGILLLCNAVSVWDCELFNYLYLGLGFCHLVIVIFAQYLV